VLQLHVNDPAVFAHAPFVLQLCVLPVHSLMSEQLVPLPVKPVLQAQLN
jgi:hypothetical protein